MKKIILCMFFLSLCLYGCGGNTGTPTDEKNTDVQTAQMAQQEDSSGVTTKDTDSVQDNTEVLPAESADKGTTDNQISADDTITFPYSVDMGSDISIDLDGDGKQEYVLFSIDTSADGYTSTPLSFIVGEKDYVEYLTQNAYMENPDTAMYYITDIDTSDSYYEIALLDWGPSDDLVSNFYRYENKNLVYIGSVEGFVGDTAFTFDGKGTINSKGRLSIFQTWWAPFTWKLNELGNIAIVADEIYYPYQNDADYEAQYPITLLQNINIYAERDLKSSKTLLTPSDSLIRFTATDNKEWVYLERDDGQAGWINMDEYSKLLYGADGSDYKEVFANLCNAD